MGDDYLSDYKWLNTREADNKAKEAKKKARDHFNKYFPNADKSKFEAQVVFDEKRNATAEIYFKAGPGFMQNVFGSDRKFWSPAIKQLLELADGFPPQLSPVIGKKFFAYPSSWFSQSRPEFEKNIQQRYKNLGHVQPIFHNKIQGNISKT